VALSLRALAGVTPALVVVGGSFWLGRMCLQESARMETVVSKVESETMLRPTPEDEDRLHRVALKQETAEDLLDGRLTFAQAIDRYVTLLNSSDDPQGPGETETDRAANQLLSFARVRATRDPQRFAERMAQLQSDAARLAGAAD
jgi:hypothetical protein